MSRHAFWLLCMVGCAPEPTIQLGSWPQDAGASESDASESESDASENENESDASEREPDASESERDAGERDAEDEEPLVPCSTQLECAARKDDRPHCSLARQYCVECLVHAHCELGEFCDSNGRCEGH